ncbi:hypothetical protein HZC32_02155, partial [Candidatus Woesearchaeota archaeon]|nr:hypothetical protein [Candidatus Woesearchaeota archaeon]
KRFKTINPESELLYFPFHQPRPNKAYSQFDDYIKKKYRAGCSSNQELHLKVPSDEKVFFSVYNNMV